MSNKGKKFLDLDQLAKFFSSELEKNLKPIKTKLDHVYNYMAKKFPDFKPVVKGKQRSLKSDYTQTLIKNFVKSL